MCVVVAQFALAVNAPSGWQEKPPAEVREKIETQDPGYLHFAVWILDRSTSEVLTFNPSQGEVARISFRLTRPARVRVRLVRRDQPDLLLKTVLDWSHLTLGRHELEWDGRDASGNITDNRKVYVLFQGDKDEEGAIDHSLHHSSKCYDLQLALVSPQGVGRLERSPGVTFELKAELAGGHAYGQESDLRLRAFLDWKPWYEKTFPKGTRSFPLPQLRSLVPGEHVVAVNVDDGHDHLGAATIKLVVRQEGGGGPPAFRCCASPLTAGQRARPPKEADNWMKTDQDTVIAGATPRRLLAPLEITKIATHQALLFDPALEGFGKLSYTLSKPAWVRIRLVSRKHPDLLLRTLVDWSYRNADRNSETWDGRDASGYWVDRAQCPGLFLIEGATLAHGEHERKRCGDPPVRISVPDHRALVRNRAVIRVACDGVKRAYLDQRGALLRVYVDYELAGERRYAPSAAEWFEWEWNAAEVSEGRHLLTVNLHDGLDHVGAASKEVEVVR